MSKPLAKYGIPAAVLAILAGAVFMVIHVVSKPLCQPGFHSVTTSAYNYGYRYLPTGKWGYGYGWDYTTTCVEGVR
jgi:hypothetical protein